MYKTLNNFLTNFLKFLYCVDETGSKGDVPKGICAVCKAENVACPRTLNPSDASQYGVKPEDITPGARVCNTCRCKVVRSQNRRVLYCTLLFCPTLQNNIRRPVKRLRPLPAKWNVAQDIIAAEFRKYLCLFLYLNFMIICQILRMIYLV